MKARALLAVFAIGFLVVGLSGLWLAALLPAHASLGGAVLAFLLGVGFAILAFRTPAPGEGCDGCGRALDPTLAFCGACGESKKRPTVARAA